MSFMGFLVGLILAVIIFWSYAILIFWPQVIKNFQNGLALSVCLVIGNISALSMTGNGYHVVLAMLSLGIILLSTRFLNTPEGQTAEARHEEEVRKKHRGPVTPAVFSAGDTMSGYTDSN